MITHNRTILKCLDHTLVRQHRKFPFLSPATSLISFSWPDLGSCLISLSFWPGFKASHFFIQLTNVLKLNVYLRPPFRTFFPVASELAIGQPISNLFVENRNPDADFFFNRPILPETPFCCFFSNKQKNILSLILGILLLFIAVFF